jgi:hypothetical protein
LKCPLLLKLHGGKSAIPIKIVIIVALLNNDNQEAYHLNSINMRSKKQRCRLCKIDYSIFNTSFISMKNNIFRDSGEIMNLLHQHQIPFLNHLTAEKYSRHDDVYDDQEKTLKSMGVNPGLNPLLSNFAWLDHHQIGNLLTCSSVDVLHTVYKGIVEYSISWSICCLYLLSGKDSSKIAQLDYRIASFQRQALNPFTKFRKFAKGISCYFRSSQSNENAMENATMASGRLEAQHLPNLFFNFMFSIGTEGRFIPNRNYREWRMNPTKIILDCCSSILDLIWLINSDSIPVDELRNFESKCNIVNCKLMRLWYLKQKVTNSSSKLSAVKPHLATHIPYNWFQFGRVKDIDTALAEHTHIADKETYQHCSKKLKTTSKEMLQRTSVKLRQSTLSHLMKHDLDNPITVMEGSQDNISYHVLSRIKYKKIFFDQITKKWFYSDRMSYFHPFLKMDKFTKLFKRYSEQGPHEKNLFEEFSLNKPIVAVQGISINPNKDSGIPKFHVYATNNYNNSGKPRYDALEIDFGEVIEMVQVHGIINLQIDNSNNILLIVHHMKVVEKKQTDSVLPYELYQYDFDNPCWDIIEPSSIYRPSMIIECPDRSNGFNNSEYDRFSKNIRMWMIRYQQIDMNGYDINDISQTELDEVEEMYKEINEEFQTEIDSSEEDEEG